MPSERSPLLNPSDAGTSPGTRPASGSPSPYYVDVPISKGFAKTSHRSSIVSGSVGRPGFGDFLVRGSPGHRATENAMYGEEGEIDVVSSEEAAILAREQQTLLADNRIPYNATNRRASLIPGSPSLPPPRGSATRRSIQDIGEEVLETATVWDDAVSKGQVNTTVRREIISLASSSAPLIVTFSLQYSLIVASIFSVGHLGATELGAVSLASMTASITGFAMIQGLATCLDTLCSQAYGAGNHHLVGMYFQKCVVMIFCCFIPVAVVWYTADGVLNLIVPEPELGQLAMEYLRIIAFGVPGYILFECGKRFTQAQGIFHASTMVLLVCSPINIILNYVLVWNDTIGMGFHGAAVAVATTDWLMAILLLCYVYFIDGRKCWNGFSKEAFTNWGPMLRLAVPGVIMVEAEFLAFEVLTLASSYFGTAALAAQSVLSTITSLAYQIPFAVSIACSTRVANFVGATLSPSAKTAGYVAIGGSYIIALFNGVVLYLFRYEVGGLFSSDEEVIQVVADVFPVCAFMQLFDAAGSVAGGVLRGQGRQRIGGYLNLFFYYVVALPLSFYLAFSRGWNLYGLWTGVTVGLVFISTFETFYVVTSDWDKIVADASEMTRSERILE